MHHQTIISNNTFNDSLLCVPMFTKISKNYSFRKKTTIRILLEFPSQFALNWGKISWGFVKTLISSFKSTLRGEVPARWWLHHFWETAANLICSGSGSEQTLQPLLISQITSLKQNKVVLQFVNNQGGIKKRLQNRWNREKYSFLGKPGTSSGT